MPQQRAKSASRPPSARRSASGADAQAQANARLLRRSLSSLRLGALSTAVIGGLACYTFLLDRGVPGVVAAIVGLLFAFLARTALISLGREWLLRQARARQARQTHPRQPDEPPRTLPLDQPHTKGYNG